MTRIVQSIALGCFYNRRTPVFIVFNLFTLCIAILNEFIQIWANGIHGYLYESANYLDFPGYISGISWTFCYIKVYLEVKHEFETQNPSSNNY